MRPDPAINVVSDPHDSLDLAKKVASLADRTEGRVVLHLTPGVASTADLAADLLVAIGKRFDALRFEKTRSRAWPLVEVWFRAEQVQHLFVLRAGRLSPPLRRRITNLDTDLGVHVWLIGASATGSGSGVGRWDTDSFGERWSEAPAAAEHGLDDAGFPEVPDDEFTTFRATCRRLLDPASFGRVDRVYCESMDATARWLAPTVRGRDRLDTNDAAVQLQSLLVASLSAAEALTRLRGAQAAYFLAGWLVPFPPSGCALMGGIVPLGPTLDPVTARRLRRLCQPSSTAAMAIMLVTDLRSKELARLNVGDVDPTGERVLVGTRPDSYFAIPPYAASLVRAQLIDRHRSGAADGDAMFVDTRTGERFEPDQLKSALRTLCRRTALAVGLDERGRWAADPTAWLRRRRLDLQFLDSEAALLR